MTRRPTRGAADPRLTHPVPAAVLRRIQAMAHRGTERHWALIPPDLAKRMKPQVVHVGDAVLTIMTNSDALRINRVTGLGYRGAASEAMIDEIIDRYRSARVRRFSLMLGPVPQRETIERWLIARRFGRTPGNVLLVRDCAVPVAAVETELRVRRARGKQVEVAVDILSEAFSTPPSRRRWALAEARSGDYECFLAWAGEEPVATAGVRIERDIAWLGGAGTATQWRRHGAQSALIAARLERAASAGCAWAWSEAAEHVPGRPDGSRRNLTRLGFLQASIVPQYVCWVGR